MNIDLADLAPGSVGPLIDDVPLVTEAMVRPYVIAISLHRGAVRLGELLTALVPHLCPNDLKSGAWSALEADYVDETRAELVCLNVLAEFVAEGLLRYNDTTDCWVAAETKDSLRFWVSKASELDGQLPLHLLRSVDTRHLKAPF